MKGMIIIAQMHMAGENRDTRKWKSFFNGRKYFLYNLI